MINHKLKYHAVTETVRKWIMEGRYKPGDQLPPDTELAEYFHMNKHTVAQGLNLLVEEDLLIRARMRGTVVKNTFTPPVTNSVPLVSLADGHFFENIVRELDKCLQEHDLYPILLNRMIAYETEDITSYLNRLISKNQPYGFLFVGESKFPYDFVQKNKMRFQNSIFLFHYHYHEEIPFCRYVLTDFTAMAQMAVEYFAERGIKKILYPARMEEQYAGPHTSYQVQIMTAMKNHAQKFGLELDEPLFWRTHGGAKLQDALQYSVIKEDIPYGLFAFSDSFIVSNVLPALRHCGFSPEDFAILAQYNTPFAENYCFDSFDVMPEKTVACAVDMLTGKNDEHKVLIKPQIIKYKK